MSLTEAVLGGDRLALARLLTEAENHTPAGRAALNELFPHTGRAHLIGVTGAPGTGKSSLVNQLALHFRGLKKRVAIVAVDPSSPFSGGAVLGDRVRMRDLSGDRDVFIRSMASRGALGGLAQTTAAVVEIFDAAGYEIILIETVGAGQGEVDIVRLAHTTLVVEAPGLGDEIQAIKAGILEIADILVVNKADRPGVENTEKALKSMLELAHPIQRRYLHHGQVMTVLAAEPASADAWTVPIQRTVATEGKGIPELAVQIDNHREYLRSSGNWTEREHARLASDVETILTQTLVDRFRQRVAETRYNEVMRQVFDRDLSPWEAVMLLTDQGSEPTGPRTKTDRAARGR